MNFFIKTIRKVLGTNRIINQNIAINKVLERQEKMIKEVYNANIFHSTINNSPWLKDKSFSPGRWAVDYSCLYVMYRLLNDMRPQNIVEFGVGQSTRMLQQYAKFHNSQIVSFESDPEWVYFLKNSVNTLDDSLISLVELEKIIYNDHEALRFKSGFIVRIEGKVDFIFLDGPKGSKRYSRSQILDIIPNKINESNFCFLIDDSQRIGEKDTINEIFNVLKRNNIDYLSTEFIGETNQTLICSPNNLYLLSM
jgi:hypothetical protein